MPRIELLTDRDALPAERRADYDAVHAILGRVGGPFGVLLHSPGLAPKICQAGAHVRLESELTLAQREVALLSTAREKDAAYEWAHHTPIARKAGVSEEAITAIRDRADTSDLADDERDIVEYVRQLLRTNRVAQDLFDVLKERHGVRWVVELTATIGQYQYISAINNAFELQPKPGGDQLPL